MKKYFKFHWKNGKVLIGAIIFSLLFIFFFWPVLVFRIAFALLLIGLIIWSIYEYKTNG